MLLQCDPIRADVALFENMDAKIALLRNGMHIVMNVPAITEHNDVSDVFGLDQVSIPLRQRREHTRVIQYILPA
ncbi:hypothetical protein WS98_23080 [Burkholderia territorii]|nr:hypothetical protein WS98_23080 [Burkholderia territorii]KWH05331.1 hypothetical protein WT59_26605 [Burkholderia territorii]